MAPEDCALCGDTVPFDTTVHLMINDHDGVDDHYVCRTCYEERFEGQFEAVQ